MSMYLIFSLLLMLIFSFFFSGMEIAFFSADKLQIELQGKQGARWARIMLKFVKKPSWFLGTTLIGNTLAVTSFGILAAYMIGSIMNPFLVDIPHSEIYEMIFQTVLSALVILFLAEFLPKSLFLINPNRMLSLLAIPFQIVFYILTPVTFFIVYLSKFVIVRILRLDYSEERTAFNLTDLNHYLENTRTIQHDNEEITLNKKIFHKATQFKNVKIRECMIPRTEIVAVEYDEGLEELKKKIIASNHSKVMVYKSSIDNIVGYCHSSALFHHPKTIQDILTLMPVVPETMRAHDLMVEMIKQRKSLAVVVDEFGGTSGIVSMEDFIEEIFGEIEDEHDEGVLIERKINDTTYMLSARHEIDYLNETYNWHLPLGDYETLGGMILSVIGNFPQKGDSIRVSPYTFVVLSTDNNRINTLKMIVNDRDEE